jgi:glycosyltransferase involved in cell wall biosynthesis
MPDWEIYFWEPNASPHKLDLYRSLMNCGSVKATHYVSQEGLPASRAAEGWAADYGSLPNIKIEPNKDEVWSIIARSSPSSVHLFSGIHWVPCIVEGIRAAIALNRRFGIMSEPRDPDGLKGLLRRAHSVLTEAQIRRHAGFVLAIGRHGPAWFRSVGYEQKKIIPFAYFVPSPLATQLFKECSEVRVAFLGRINRNKGIHLFLDALPRIKHPLLAEIAGSGPDVSLIEQAQKSLRVPINYNGAIPMSEVSALLQRTDILILPSVTKDDGWGAVVGEALLAGAAVVASDHVGASICLDDELRGKVVTELSGAAVARATNELIEGQLLTRVCRERRASWAHSRLTGEAGARYLTEILAHLYAGADRPRPFYE